MEDFIVGFMTSKGILAVYAFVLLASFLEYVFPPFPSDTVLLFSGVLAGTKFLNPVILFLLSIMGSAVGYLLLYEMGLRRGRQFFLERNYSWFPRHRILELETWFERHGGKILIVNRFFAGFRAVFFIAAGVGRMNRIKVIVYGALSCALWSAILLTLGYVVGIHWREVKRYLGMYYVVFMVVLASVAVLWLIRRRRRVKNPDGFSVEDDRHAP